MSRSIHRLLVLFFLLMGAWLRFSELDTLHWVLDYDEAYYGVNALSLLEQPRFTPFFTENYGRESLWMYTLLPALAVIGAKTFALRLTIVLVSMLTLAATYRLAHVLFGRETALWTLAGLSVLYWHVHLSHIAMRAVEYPFIGAMAFAALFSAYRHNRWRDWVSVGAWFGLLSYTYIAARVWLFLAGLLIAAWFLRRQRRRGGIFLAVVITFVIAYPLLEYIASHPAIAASRLESEAITWDATIQNGFAWASAWLYRGMVLPILNADYRPILDIPLALLSLVGLWALTRRQVVLRGGFVLLLAGAALAPSLFSNFAPHFLRAVGVVIPLALVIGLGATQLRHWLPRRIQRYGLLLMTALFIWAGVHTRQDFAHWAQTFQFPEARQVRLERLYAMMGMLDDDNSLITGRAVYAEPDGEDLPLWNFLAYDRQIPLMDILEFPNCTIGRPLPFDYIGAVANAPGSAARWGEVTLRRVDPAITRYHWGYGIYAVNAPFDQPLGTFGNQFAAALVNSLPVSDRRGTTLNIHVRLTPQSAIEQPATLFVHLYPLDIVDLLAQSDTPICPDYAPMRWYSENRAALISTTLALPDDLQPGKYRVVLGIYNSQTLERLPTIQGDTIIEIGQLTVK
jgi:hypothetical protein